MNSRPASYTGDLFLNFDDGVEEAEYSARVTRATILEGDWVIQFSGTDREHGPYVGDMRLKSSGKVVKGEGTFRFVGDDPVAARINAKVIRKNKSTVTCEGTWFEPEEAATYEMILDLVSLSSQKSGQAGA